MHPQLEAVDRRVRSRRARLEGRAAGDVRRRPGGAGRGRAPGRWAAAA